MPQPVGQDGTGYEHRRCADALDDVVGDAGAREEGWRIGADHPGKVDQRGEETDPATGQPRGAEDDDKIEGREPQIAGDDIAIADNGGQDERRGQDAQFDEAPDDVPWETIGSDCPLVAMRDIAPGPPCQRWVFEEIDQGDAGGLQRDRPFLGPAPSRFHQPPPSAWNSAAVLVSRAACAWTRVSSVCW